MVIVTLGDSTWTCFLCGVTAVTILWSPVMAHKSKWQKWPKTAGHKRSLLSWFEFRILLFCSHHYQSKISPLICKQSICGSTNNLEKPNCLSLKCPYNYQFLFSSQAPSWLSIPPTLQQASFCITNVSQPPPLQNLLADLLVYCGPFHIYGNQMPPPSPPFKKRKLSLYHTMGRHLALALCWMHAKINRRIAIQ